jgi:carbamoyltransferase
MVMQDAGNVPSMFETARISGGAREGLRNGPDRTVERDVNPLYWNLFREFDRLENVPVVVNLLFRLRGEPIVGCPTDAVHTSYSSGLDALVIGSFVVEK